MRPNEFLLLAIWLAVTNLAIDDGFLLAGSCVCAALGLVASFRQWQKGAQA